MKHRYEKIINGTEKQKQEVDAASQQAFETGWSDNAAIVSREVPLTPFHEFVKRDLQEYTQRFIADLAIAKDANEPNLVVVKKGGTYEIEQGRLSGGYHSSRSGFIVADDSESRAVFASRVAHEYFHSLGYGSLQIIGDEPDDETHPYRSGISMNDREDPLKRYFGAAEEALAANFAQSYLEHVKQHDQEIATEVQSRDVIVEWFKQNEAFKSGYPEDKYTKFIGYLSNLKTLPDAEDVVAVLQDATKDDDYKIGVALAYLKERFKDYDEYMFERQSERKKLEEYIEKIVTASDASLTAHDVTKAFYRAHFIGNYLPLARMVESVLGPGSFRVMAEELSSKRTVADDADMSES